MPDAAFYLHLDGYEGFDKSVDFDKKAIRVAFRGAGRLVQRSARKLVSKRGGSKPGEFPARRTGLLGKAIGVKVSRSGFLVRVAPTKIPGMKSFYPAYLGYGVKRKPGVRRDKRSHGNAALRIDPRGNYVIAALDENSAQIQTLLRAAFESSLRIK